MYVPLIGALACGRVGFNGNNGDGQVGAADGRIAKDGHAAIADAAYFDAPGTMSIDAPRPIDGSVAACASFDLGSALGTNIATGNTTGQGDHYSAQQRRRKLAHDVSFAWTAPSSRQSSSSIRARAPTRHSTRR